MFAIVFVFVFTFLFVFVFVFRWSFKTEASWGFSQMYLIVVFVCVFVANSCNFLVLLADASHSCLSCNILHKEHVLPHFKKQSTNVVRLLVAMVCNGCASWSFNFAPSQSHLICATSPQSHILIFGGELWDVYIICVTSMFVEENITSFLHFILDPCVITKTAHPFSLGTVVC